MDKERTLSLEIEPYVGAKPILFGMSPDKVQEILGEKPDSAEKYENGEMTETEYYDGGIRIHYGETEKVDELSFLPKSPDLLTFGGVELFNPKKVKNPLSVLLKLDKNPLERVGFVIFPKLGVAITGYHDGDKSQRAITVFKEWLGLSKAKPIDLSKFADDK